MQNREGGIPRRQAARSPPVETIYLHRHEQVSYRNVISHVSTAVKRLPPHMTSTRLVRLDETHKASLGNHFVGNVAYATTKEDTINSCGRT